MINIASGEVANTVGTALYANHMGSIYAPSVSLSGNGTDANPTVNTVGNDNSYIDT